MTPNNNNYNKNNNNVRVSKLDLVKSNFDTRAITMLLLLFKFKRRKKEEISFQLLVYGFQLRYKIRDGFPRARE